MAPLRLSDFLPAGGLFALGIAEIVGFRGDGRGAVAAVVAAVMASLVGRRFAPVAVGLVVATGLAVTSMVALHIDVLALLLSVLLAGYTIGQERRPAVAASGAAGMLAVIWVAVLASPAATAGSLLFTAIAVLVPVLAGQALRSVREQAVRERAAAERRAVEDEQARIARELHDVVAHGISLMVLHAGAAHRLVESDPERGREALALIEHTGRESLQELQRLLGVLRPRSSTRAVEPQPGLGDIATLVEQVRAAGTEVRLETKGLGRPVPPGVALAAYRIVQEALTNTTRHAPEATVTVRLAVQDTEIVMQVDDHGGFQDAGTGAAGGHGLVGMRERARMYGGDVHAGPASDGWNVHARLPLQVP